MSLLTSIIFQELLNIKSECNTYKIDSEPYIKCIKLQLLSNELLEQIQLDNLREFEQFKQLQEMERFQQYQQALEYFYTLIDTNLDQYLDLGEQEQIFKDMFNSNIDENDNFTPPGE